MKPKAHLIKSEGRQHFDSTELKKDASPSSPGGAADVESAGRTVLLIADDMSRKLASIALTRGAFRVEVTEEEAKAAAMIAKKVYDAVLISEHVGMLAIHLKS